MGQEITEVLEYNPANIFVRKIIRPKYTYLQGIKIAELPSLPLPKSNAGSSMLSHITVSKFVDHLPFHRLIQIYKRQGLNLSDSTLGGWFKGVSVLLEPLYKELHCQVVTCRYLQMDESPIGVQDSHKQGALHTGYQWVVHNPEKRLVLFKYAQGRGGSTPHELLKEFSGTLQTDGYQVYQSLNLTYAITLLGCLAHGRRYFEKALDNDKSRSTHAMEQIQRLYAMERKAKDKSVNVDVLKRYRQLYAIPILHQLEIWMKDQLLQVLPKSAIGKALAYNLGIWKNISRYTEEGFYNIDNNLIEKSIRPLALGRKNYLFAGSHQSAQHIAIFYSFFASCKVNKIDPQAWLTDVLNRINDTKLSQLNDLLPNNWKPINSSI
jgi:transposase